jgi:hypothetical protein
MSGSQSEIKFFTNFPTKETLKLLLEWQTLYAEVQSERQRMTLISAENAMSLLGIPARKLNQFVKDGFLKQKSDGRIFKYQVIKLLFEMKQAELFESIN